MRDKFGRWWLAALAGVLALATTALIYWPGLGGPFVFDDLPSIIEMPALRISDLSFHSLRDAALAQKSSFFGRPVAMLSFALNYYFADARFSAVAYKLTNLVIHFVNGIALYWLCLRLLQRQHATHQTAFSTKQLPWLSLGVCALWLVHPLNLTSVLYIVQRMTSLASLFVIAGLLGYVIGREQLLRGQKRGFLIMLASLLVFGGLAIFSKEIGVLLLPYMFVIEIVFYRFAAPQHLRRPLKAFWLALLALPAAAVLLILAVQPESLLGVFNYQYRDFSLTERLLTEPRALWFYLRLILLPDIAQMGIYHDDFAVSRGLFDPPSTVFALLGIAALLALAVTSYRRHPILSFAIAWFLVGHSLESTILPLELVHEHRNYLPQFGILFALVYYLTYPYARLTKSLTLRQGLVVLILALFAGITYARALDWKDEWTLYNKDVLNHPTSPRARTMLGIILHDNKQYAAAEVHFRKAAELDPHDSKAILRLAQHLYVATGDIPEDVLSELEYRLFKYPYTNITLWTFEPILNNTLKDPELNLRFVRVYERLLQRTDIVLMPGWYELGYRMLAFTFRERGDYEEALSYFNKAAELNPRPAYDLLRAEIYVKIERVEKAKEFANRLMNQTSSLNDDEAKRLDNLRKTLNMDTANTLYQ